MHRIPRRAFTRMGPLVAFHQRVKAEGGAYSGAVAGEELDVFGVFAIF